MVAAQVQDTLQTLARNHYLAKNCKTQSKKTRENDTTLKETPS